MIWRDTSCLKCGKLCSASPIFGNPDNILIYCIHCKTEIDIFENKAVIYFFYEKDDKKYRIIFKIEQKQNTLKIQAPQLIDSILFFNSDNSMSFFINSFLEPNFSNLDKYIDKMLKLKAFQ